MYKNRFGINNLQWLMCHKIKPIKRYEEQWLAWRLDMDMIEDYVLSHLFSVVHFLACGHAFS